MRIYADTAVSTAFLIRPARKQATVVAAAGSGGRHRSWNWFYRHDGGSYNSNTTATIDHRDFRAHVSPMFNSTIPKSLKVAVAAGFISALAFSPLALAAEQGKENLDASASKEITGEVVDMMCYVDHNAIGDKHAGCAAKCIKGGGPVGIVSDGKAYLLVGQHKPINDQLAEYAGKTITVKGKMAERGGVAMLENAEIEKK